MTTLSPTPFAVSSFGNGRLPQHALGRPYPRDVLRPSLRRQSPLSVLGHGHGFSADAPMIQRISIGDSSEDDIPIPMNFSALTKAILEDKHSAKVGTPTIVNSQPSSFKDVEQSESPWARNSSATPSRKVLRILRNSPPPPELLEEGSAPRVVHLSASRRTPGLKKSASTAEIRSSGKKEATQAPEQLITPAYALRTRPTVQRTYSALSSDAGLHRSGASGSAGRTSAEDGEDENGYPPSGQGTSEERASSRLQDSVSRGTMTGLADQVPGSSRLKRTNLTKSVRGAPMRRPFRRRASDADNSPLNEGDSATKQSPVLSARSNTPLQTVGNNIKPHHEPILVTDFAEKHNHQDIAQNPIERVTYDALSSQKPDAVVAPRAAVVPASQDLGPQSRGLQAKFEPRPPKEQQVFRIPALPPPLPSFNDQENEPPPTFKKNKAPGFGMLAPMDKPKGLADQRYVKPLADSSRPRSPPRQALLPLSINTPQRAAPPPPKMTVLETATAPAGASTVKSKKKRTHISVNGKMFTHRGRLGKGGSSDVYRVMAENDKMFALKRVNLADCDEDVVRGYKGEIELLQKLKNVERVVKLYDWEVNEEKQSLSVLMEIGESDFNSLLNKQLRPEGIAPEDVKLDLSFTRYYWREMLCCVAAIHDYDIVHSDLKPSNFLLVQGRLKLIDFGIANAIDTDNTVNVHRETNVGTPNYMSPESLIDTNAEQRNVGPGSSHKTPRLMKLGKPCDVWTLGCILYQMTYGQPPFAHIKNQWHRIMAIINPNHTIEFPDYGLGGVTVPSSLRDLLRSCLNRDAAQRPTLAQLLDDRDRFLNPDRETAKWERDGAVPVTEHVLEQILTRIVERCRDPKRGIPTDDEVKAYPRAFLDRVREMQRV